MIGIPIELYPYFPTNADLVLLTESAKFDPDIVNKIKRQLDAGKSVVITSGLLHALADRGINDIVELRYTDRKLLAHEFYGGFGAGNGADLGNDPNAAILLPVIEFLTNDAWPLVRAMANGGACPAPDYGPLFQGRALHADHSRQLCRFIPVATPRHERAQRLSDARLSRPPGRSQPGRVLRV